MRYQHFLSIAKGVENHILTEFDSYSECLVYTPKVYLYPYPGGNTIDEIRVTLTRRTSPCFPFCLSCTIDVAGRDPDPESLSQEAMLYLTYGPDNGGASIWTAGYLV